MEAENDILVRTTIYIVGYNQSMFGQRRLQKISLKKTFPRLYQYNDLSTLYIYQTDFWGEIVYLFFLFIEKLLSTFSFVTQSSLSSLRHCQDWFLLLWHHLAGGGSRSHHLLPSQVPSSTETLRKLITEVNLCFWGGNVRRVQTFLLYFDTCSLGGGSNSKDKL